MPSDPNVYHPPHPENGVQARFARIEEKMTAISAALEKFESVPLTLVQIQTQMGTHSTTFSRLFNRLEEMEKFTRAHDLGDLRVHSEQESKINAVDSKVNKIIWAGGGMIAAATGMWGLFSWILSGSLYRLLEAMKDIPS